MERVFLHTTFPSVCATKTCPFLASTLLFAFAFALRLFTRVLSCARANQPGMTTLTSVLASS